MLAQIPKAECSFYCPFELVTGKSGSFAKTAHFSNTRQVSGGYNLPYLIPKTLVDKKRIILVLAFGALSLLEASLALSQLQSIERLCDRAAILTLGGAEDDEIKRIASIHKLVSPVLKINELTDSSDEIGIFFTSILNRLEENFTFSVSLYCNQTNLLYDEAVNFVLSAIRKEGFRKAKLVRPRNEIELRAEDVQKRQIIDFVIFPCASASYFGVTAYVQNAQEFRNRGTRRPEVNPISAMSPRLAKALVNIAHLNRGELLLDPFCGAGTILSEAILQGINCIGLDRDPNAIRQAKANLSWLETQTHSRSLGSYELKVGNARNLQAVIGPRKVHAIVTEPILLPTLHSSPNFDSAKRMMDMSSSTYSEALHSMAGIMKEGGRIVIVVPTLKTADDRQLSITFQDLDQAGLEELRPVAWPEIEYPVPVDFSSTRWIRRSVYAFVSVGSSSNRNERFSKQRDQ
jgi:tRNA G10  N-methylase Trm11